MLPTTPRARSLVLAVLGVTLTGLAASLALALAITALHLPDPPRPGWDSRCWRRWRSL